MTEPQVTEDKRCGNCGIKPKTDSFGSMSIDYFCNLPVECAIKGGWEYRHACEDWRPEAEE